MFGHKVYMVYFEKSLTSSYITLSTWKMRSSSQTFSKHLSRVSTNTYVETENTTDFTITSNLNNTEIKYKKTNIPADDKVPGLSLEYRVHSLMSLHRKQSTMWRSVCKSACCLNHLSTWVYKNKSHYCIIIV